MGALKISTSRKQIMKRSFFLKFATLGLLAAVAATGCKKTPKHVTPIHGSATRVGSAGAGNALTNAADTRLIEGASVIPIRPPVTTGENFPPITDRTTNGTSALTGPEIIDGHHADRVAFAASTIHFDYDKAVMKAAELGKLQPVIAALKAAPQNKLRVEGHCDERGTEEYNRTLGERRALAIRAQLIKSGIAPARVTTMSFGEDKPAELGHTDEAWAKNRRGELVLLKP